MQATGSVSIVLLGVARFIIVHWLTPMHAGSHMPNESESRCFAQARAWHRIALALHSIVQNTHNSLDSVLAQAWFKHITAQTRHCLQTLRPPTADLTGPACCCCRRRLATCRLCPAATAL